LIDQRGAEREERSPAVGLIGRAGQAKKRRRIDARRWKADTVLGAGEEVLNDERRIGIIGVLYRVASKYAENL
jgi:hypothetical protein